MVTVQFTIHGNFLPLTALIAYHGLD